MNFKDTMTIQTRSILLVILIITTAFSLGIFVFAQVPPGQIVNDSSNIQPLNNSVTLNLKNLMANATGHISSAQNDGNNTWITWGKWALVRNTSEVLQNDSNPLRFNATINSVKSDNTERHNHEIHDFKLTDSSVTKNGESTILMLDGTATIVANDQQSMQVPVSIKIIETGQATAWNNTESEYIDPSLSPKGGTISILIDDKKFHGHFGDTPIYGVVNKPKVP
jgi:hypothetical protein